MNNQYIKLSSDTFNFVDDVFLKFNKKKFIEYALTKNKIINKKIKYLDYLTSVKKTIFSFIDNPYDKFYDENYEEQDDIILQNVKDNNNLIKPSYYYNYIDDFKKKISIFKCDDYVNDLNMYSNMYLKLKLLTVKILKDYCKINNIKNYSNKNKTDLIEFILTHIMKKKPYTDFIKYDFCIKYFNLNHNMPCKIYVDISFKNLNKAVEKNNYTKGRCYCFYYDSV